ncbi:hypothetical protein DDE82_001469 [Stemphylium lycopersici]|nr:hypothetical protein TW65_08355 [Stemphylium lycopersici]RAR09752.1 hypothetical protein DDE82_001469 [Stemphylium lycopersici]
MAYEPIQLPKGPHISSYTEIALGTHYDSGSYNSGLTQDDLSDRNIKDEVQPSKGIFRSRENPEEQWPLHAQRVARMTPLKILLMIYDAILASVPIMFIALALTAARLNGKEVSDYGKRLEETLLLSPTIFPLLFAALMGRFFRHLGLWLAQRGTTLGRLEQLIGCQSVFSALERQFSLGSWSTIGLASVLIWLLSPVGGQSALRLLSHEVGEIQSTGHVRYLDPNAVMDSIMMGSSFINAARSTFSSIFFAALLSSPKYQHTPMDLWGNVKLPLYRDIENSTLDEWKTISNSTSENVTYASLIGIPVAGLSSDGFSTFNLRSRIWDVRCSSNEGVKERPSDFKNEFTWELKIADDTTPLCANATKCPPMLCEQYPCPMQSESAASNETNAFSITKCEISLGNFETGVRCNGTACAAYKMRQIDLLDDDFTAGLDMAVRKFFLPNMLLTLATADNYNVGSAIARGSTNMEKWIYDPTDFIGVLYANVDLWELSPEVFGDRFTILINSFWQSTYGTIALAGNLPASVMQTGWMNSTTATGELTFLPSKCDITRNTSPVYRINWQWFSALLISSLILLIAAYAGLLLKYITMAPDIIGYASSLTLLNPYVQTPTGGTTLNGLERAALLRDIPVRIGDVCPEEAVGAIAFVRADTREVMKLDRKRWYI